ncbi:unnamed protein product [Darwinula stevensoni]|uniref:NADP-dependent oxidoreductase domain-containing protein n=1 Tax=Darwinula stevensoni TaxID=69355 RepID=A0A7R8XA34_9CRUS|nr:unnamed protein product [Darwinula stevensoni]CAG0890261.1 unnamed protein product [Darwinula stevensoni]
MCTSVKPALEMSLKLLALDYVNLYLMHWPMAYEQKLLEFCEKKGIVLTAYSPLGSPDRPWAKPDDPSLFEDPKIQAIAKKYGKSKAQILLCFQVQRMVAVIPKSITKSCIEENFRIFDFELDPVDMKELESFNLEARGRLCHQQWDKSHKYYPFNIEF